MKQKQKDGTSDIPERATYASKKALRCIDSLATLATFPDCPMTIRALLEDIRDRAEGAMRYIDYMKNPPKKMQPYPLKMQKLEDLMRLYDAPTEKGIKR